MVNVVDRWPPCSVQRSPAGRRVNNQHVAYCDRADACCLDRSLQYPNASLYGDNAE